MKTLPLVAFALLSATACSSGGATGDKDAGHSDAAKEAAPGDAGADAFPCPSLADAEQCTPPTPSYKTDIVPILQERCAPCHFDGGVEDYMYDFSTYDSVDNADTSIQSQLYRCEMPPALGIPKIHVAPAPPLSDVQRLTLFNWLRCGAPNN